MSEIITKGYLINKEKYNIYDEIITFINEHNLKFTCFCAGTQKINSKNSRSLDYGNYLEFDFFYSSHKLSKLKKVTTINEMHIENKKKLSLAVINEYFFKYQISNFKFYQQCILYMNMNINDYLLVLYILINLVHSNGLKIDYDKNSPFYMDLQNETNNNLLQAIDQKQVDLNLIQEFSIQQLKFLIKKIHYFLYENTGIYLINIKNML